MRPTSVKLHVVDGTFELFRCWFGSPRRQTSDGREVGAVHGLMRTLYRLLQASDTTHIGVAYDRVIESFRNDLFPGYKTGAGIDPLLLAQFPLAEQATRALGVTVWPMVRYEAQPGMGLAIRKHSLAQQGVIAHPTLRRPGPSLSADSVKEITALAERQARRLRTLGF